LIDHVLGPFLKWVNTDLSAASALAFMGVGGVTWAKLVGEDFTDKHLVELVRSD
jgi:hypothetical protein